MKNYVDAKIHFNEEFNKESFTNTVMATIESLAMRFGLGNSHERYDNIRKTITQKVDREFTNLWDDTDNIRSESEVPNIDIIPIYGKINLIDINSGEIVVYKTLQEIRCQIDHIYVIMVKEDILGDRITGCYWTLTMIHGKNISQLSPNSMFVIDINDKKGHEYKDENSGEVINSNECITFTFDAKDFQVENTIMKNIFTNVLGLYNIDGILYEQYLGLRHPWANVLKFASDIFNEIMNMGIGNYIVYDIYKKQFIKRLYYDSSQEFICVMKGYDPDIFNMITIRRLDESVYEMLITNGFNLTKVAPSIVTDTGFHNLFGDAYRMFIPKGE